MTRPTVLALAAALTSCNPPPTQAQLDQTRGGSVDTYFNDPGTWDANTWRPDVLDVMIEMIDGAQDPSTSR